jgi:hypothetical protein
MVNVPPHSTAVAPYVAPSPLAMTNGLRPANLEQAIMLVTKLAGSMVLPAPLREPAALLLVVLRADDLGLSVAQAIEGLHVIKTKSGDYRIAMSAALMMGCVIRRPDLCEYFRVVEDTAARVTYETKRKGGLPQQASFSMDEARTAGLLANGEQSNWAKYPGDMMHARARARLARRVYPDVLLGMASREELVDGAIDLEETPNGYSAPTPPVANGASSPPPIAHRDVKPANVIDVQSEPVNLDRLAFERRIQGAKTLGELEALAPQLRSLPEVDAAPLRPMYRAAKELLARMAAAPTAPPSGVSTFHDAPKPAATMPDGSRRTWGDGPEPAANEPERVGGEERERVVGEDDDR